MVRTFRRFAERRRVASFRRVQTSSGARAIVSFARAKVARGGYDRPSILDLAFKKMLKSVDEDSRNLFFGGQLGQSL